MSNSISKVLSNSIDDGESMKTQGGCWLAMMGWLALWGCSGGDTLFWEDMERVWPQELEIRDVVVFVTETTATIQWKSRRQGVGQVLYGSEGALDQQSPQEAEPGLRHEVRLEGLQPATRYTFQVVVQTTEGKTFRSELYEFITLGGRLGKIAFISDRDGGSGLYVMNEDGSNPTRLVENAFQPAWSPDGSQLVFVSTRNGSSDLWLIRADGSDLRPLTNTPDVEEWHPAWSPNGRSIAYVAGRYRASGAEIYVLDVDNPGSPRRLTNNVFLDDEPDWSPDGQRLVFVSMEGTAAIELSHRPVREGSVVVKDALGKVIPPEEWSLVPETGLLDLSGAAGAMGQTVQVFYESLDGEGGAAVARSETYQVPLPNKEIFVMRADGSQRRRLTRNEAADFSPKWSPLGDKILFVSDRDGNMEIYLMDANGANQQNLTRDSNGDWAPAWSPNGQEFLWVAFRFGQVDIYRRTLDGSQIRNLTHFTSGDHQPAWGP